MIQLKIMDVRINQFWDSRKKDVLVVFLSKTVKLGYNDHGYNEFMAIMDKYCRIIWSQMLLYHISLHGYNYSPTEFVITEFGFTLIVVAPQTPPLEKVCGRP